MKAPGNKKVRLLVLVPVLNILSTVCVTIYSCIMKEIKILIHKEMVQLIIYHTNMEA